MVNPAQLPGGAAAALTGGKDQALAQGLYMAQLAAMRGNCKCDTCRIVRKMSDSMVKSFIESKDAAPTDGKIDLAAAAGAEEDGGAGGGDSQ